MIALPDQPGRVISNFYALMDDRSAQGVVLSACAPAALGQYRMAYRTNAGQTRLPAIRRLIRRNEELGYTCEAERWREEITPSEEDQEVFECYL